MQEHDNISDMGISGEELYTMFLAGDESAFEQLVMLYEDDLFGYINSIIRDRYEARQLTIETFAQLIVNTSKFKGNSSLKTYLFAIGRNISAHHLKSRIHDEHIPFDDIVESLVDNAEPIESFMEREESRQVLREAMLDLKQEYRIVLTLLYFEDMSYAQAGKSMDKTEKQVKNLAYQAKLALRHALEANEHF